MNLILGKKTINIEIDSEVTSSITFSREVCQSKILAENGFDLPEFLLHGTNNNIRLSLNGKDYQLFIQDDFHSGSIFRMKGEEDSKKLIWIGTKLRNESESTMYPTHFVSGLEYDGKDLSFNWVVSLDYELILADIKENAGDNPLRYITMSMLRNEGTFAPHYKFLNIYFTNIMDRPTNEDIMQFLENAPKTEPKLTSLTHNILVDTLPSGSFVSFEIGHIGTLRAIKKGKKIEDTAMITQLEERGLKFVSVQEGENKLPKVKLQVQ